MHNQEKHHYRREKVQAILHEIAFYLELVAALLVVILIIFQVVGLGIDMFSDVSVLSDSEHFTYFLELALNIVVGIEFLKMLCRHNMDAVIEVLLFTLARHLIVNQHSMVEGLLCIVSIAILFIVRKYLFVPKIDKNPLSFYEEKEDEDECRH